MSGLRHLLASLIAAALLAGAVPAYSAVTENDVKAAFLPRFARYVDWPASAMPPGPAPIVLCVIGSDPFGDGLDAAARSQSVGGKRVIVRRLGSANGAGGCQIAYVAANTNESVGQLLVALRGKPVLTVTDERNSSARGIVHFLVVDGRVRFAIDEAEAARRGLSISSRLLALATSVKQR